eukprot:8245922-Alexandrium_andersonii.AAC.1
MLGLPNLDEHPLQLAVLHAPVAPGAIKAGGAVAVGSVPAGGGAAARPSGGVCPDRMSGAAIGL